jgi:hypothetical protein
MINPVVDEAQRDEDERQCQWAYEPARQYLVRQEREDWQETEAIVESCRMWPIRNRFTCEEWCTWQATVVDKLRTGRDPDWILEWFVLGLAEDTTLQKGG